MKITDLDEGIFDLFKRGADASGLNNIGNMAGKTQADMPTIARKAKELLDRSMPEPQIIQALQQEFGVNPRAATEAVRMAAAGVGMGEDEDLGNVIKTGVKGSYAVVAKAIKDFEELIRNNPNHPKVPQVKAELAKLRPQLAQARKDSGMGESATAGATSAGSVAAVAAPIGGMQSRQPKNPDGTAKNALDSDTLMAGKKKKTKSKKA